MRLSKLNVLLVLIGLCTLALGWDWWAHRREGAAAEATPGWRPTLAQAEALAPLVNPEARFTVVHFWATWCPPCMVEMPHVLESLKTLPPDVAVTMVSLDAPPPEDFYNREAITPLPRATAPVSWLDDPQQERAKTILGKVLLPTTLIVDGRHGTVLQQIDGPLSWPPLMKVLAGL